MNITDVGHMTSDEDAGEDKIEKTARAEGQIAARSRGLLYRAVQARLRLLNIELPDSRTRPHPPQMRSAARPITSPTMIALIERIIARGYAYVAP